jgi:Ion channel
MAAPGVARATDVPAGVARLLGGRFTVLTCALVLLATAATTIQHKAARDVVVGLAFSVLLVFAMLTAGRHLRIATMALALPTLVSHWLLRHLELPALRYVDFALTSAFLAFLTLVIMVAVFRDRSVTADTIVGAICAYLLIGVTWGSVYALLVFASPDSLSVSPALARVGHWGESISPFTPLLLYYSYTTLSTLGYGDVTPLSAGARALAVLEGLTGQIYLAVLVARLVGLHIARVPRP